ncbi:hypothetical protein [Mesorhizobium amorphae]|uniref:hypothetical protein n=1 Tax=Mesorhizobium amorphae TaxID=71433 RepID=UPI001182FC07|nr:hypothetical protein [Mesorhizobium amorphae]
MNAAALTLVFLVIVLAGWAIFDRRATEKKIQDLKAKKKAYVEKLAVVEANQAKRAQENRDTFERMNPGQRKDVPKSTSGHSWLARRLS